MTLAAQWLGLRAERRRRDADYKRAQQALAASLLFKVRRIHTDYLGVLTYIEESFGEAAKRGNA